MSRSVLVVDDEKLVRWSLRESLREKGYEVSLAESGEEALRLAKKDSFDVILLDIRLPDIDGVEVLRRIRSENQDASVIMISAVTDVETAVETIRLGAKDFATKPLDPDDISFRIERVLAADRLRSQFEHLQKSQKESTPRVVGESPAIQRLLRQAAALGKGGAPTVLITGESGTGKDLLARTVHSLGPRRETPFMEIHCSAIPESLLESELFGYEKGAFTDARSRKQGLLELADGGVVFLNEIGDLPMPTQAKLLGVLENRSFRRLGGTSLIRVDVQILAATNQDLNKLIQKGLFRQDLYYRLNVIRLELPPLRERKDDIPHLIEHFLDFYNRQFRKQFAGCEADALEYLVEYPWPGNIRELQNVVERVVLMEEGPRVQLAHLPCEILEFPEKRDCAMASGCTDRCLKVCLHGDFSLERAERILIEAALSKTKGNQTQAAGLLGVTRDTLRYRLQKLDLRSALKETGVASEPGAAE
jgi:DNA-binding NtrC family response regulator